VQIELNGRLLESAGLDAPWPRHDERHAHAAFERVRLLPRSGSLRAPLTELIVEN
jgi:hypothetical protein